MRVVPNHLYQFDCLFNNLKISKLCISGPALLALCDGNPLVTGGFPSQRASNMGSVSMSWRHHVLPILSPVSTLVLQGQLHDVTKRQLISHLDWQLWWSLTFLAINLHPSYGPCWSLTADHFLEVIVGEGTHTCVSVAVFALCLTCLAVTDAALAGPEAGEKGFRHRESLLTRTSRDKMVVILADDIFKFIFLNENCCIFIKISLKCVPGV